MKKIISIILTICVIFTAFIGCSKSNNEQSKELTVDNSITQETTTVITTEKNQLLESIYHKAGVDFFVDVPLWSIRKGISTTIYTDDKNKYIAVTNDQRVGIIGSDGKYTVVDGKRTNFTDLDDLHDYIFNIYKEECKTSGPAITFESINIEKESYETINGIRAYKYEGTIKCFPDFNNKKDCYDTYIIGYSFMYNNLPYNISGSVTDREQSKDDINEIKSLVESMIQTVRSTW